MKLPQQHFHKIEASKVLNDTNEIAATYTYTGFKALADTVRIKIRCMIH